MYRRMIVLAALLLPLSALAQEDPCAALNLIHLPDVEVTLVETLTEPVSHCKLTGVIGREIGFSVWFPREWHGGFLMGGGGGFVGRIENHALFLGALQRGYATAGTDTGHQAVGLDSRWANQNLERIVNYGHVAIHRVAEVAKHMVVDHYGAEIDKSYFGGCSNGGRQALAFAQRYPTDFTGIIAGAPALNWTGTAAGFVSIQQKMYPNPNDLEVALLSEADRKHIASAVLDACDGLDGVEDGVMNDPRDCTFSTDALDLPAEKIAAVNAIYDGPMVGDEAIFFGFPFGGEDLQGGWGNWLTGGANQLGVPNAAYGFGVGIMRNFIYHDADWSYVGYDFASYKKDAASIGATLNADNADLDAFRANGGKLLLYHGWSDAALTAYGSIDYVDRVYAREADAKDDVRLFLMPGVLHCAGGPGAQGADFMSVLEAWEQGGEPPESIPATRPDGAGRPLCAYPTRVTYVDGDTTNIESFACR